MTGRRVVEVVRQEINGTRPIVRTGLLISRLIPDLVGNRLRTSTLRACGLSIGTGTVVGGGFRLAGTGRVQDRLRIGARCFINAGCFFDASAPIRVGDDVAMGQQVLILTQTHVIGPASRRADALTESSVTVGDGCWVGARVVVLPGVTIGAGAVVAAGAVVRTDVPACAVVAGVPARVVRILE